MSRSRAFLILFVLLMSTASCNLQDPGTSADRDGSLSDPTDAASLDVSDTTTEADVASDASASDTDTTDALPQDTGNDTGDDFDIEECATGETRCTVGCVDTSSDPDHCGGCETSCVPPANASVLACQDSGCVFECEQGYFDLNDNLGDPDADGCEADCKPSNGGVELCIDGVDNDCNGMADDGCVCNPGEEFDCGTDVGQCEFGTVTCQTGGQPGSCENAVESVPEICNGLDDDCDGDIDEDLTRSCGSNVGACSEGTETCSSGSWGACLGGTLSSTDVCDNIDNDCDGDTDEDYSQKGQSCTVGVGACKRTGTYVCNSAGTGVACDATAGSPSTEICDNIDNDCNNQVDDNVTRSCGTNIGQCSEGTETCSSGSWGSCQGATGSTAETCDGQDNDCDGVADNGVKTTYYFDADDDTYGTSSSIDACGPSGNYTATRSGDCNDNDDTINPGATQFCSGSIDQDCDGDVACADSECDGQGCLAPGGGTCQAGSCVPNDDGTCRVLCRVDEYCTCGGTECCPDGQQCLCP